MRWTILAALMLAGCDARTGADDYRFERREMTLSPVTVTLVEYDRPADLLAAAERLGARFGHDRDGQAFGILRPALQTCEIHMVRPEVRWAPEWLGHEAAHCFWGRWHP